MIRRPISLPAAALLGAFVLAAIAASTATASTLQYVVHETRLVGEAGIEGTGGEANAKVESTIAGAKVTVQCKKTALGGALEEAAKSKETVELTECKLLEGEKELTACKVAEPVVAKLAGTLVGKEGIETAEPLEEKLSPREGTEFAKIEVTGETCPAKGKYALTGSDDCLLPGGEEEATAHEFECTSSGSKLKLGSEKASFTDTKKYKLKDGDAFAGVKAALISFMWRVGGAQLANNVEKVLGSVGLEGAGNLTIAGTAKTVRFSFECNTFALKAGATKRIVGYHGNNLPSYMQLSFEISGCTGSFTPTGCSLAEAIKSPLLLGLQYEGIEGSSPPEKRYLLGFRPNDHTERTLFDIKFANVAACGMLQNATIEAAVGPWARGAGLLGQMENSEVPIQTITFPPTYSRGARWLTGTTYPAFLRVAEGGTETSSEITVTGKLVAELETAERWRAE
jgi:hypothetical protein